MNEEAKEEPAEDIFKTGYEKAVGLLHECATEGGFLASTTDRANYRRIWARDGSILSLAALKTGDDELIDCVQRTLRTLANHQGPHGEIPSNVDTSTGRVSYGGAAGRVDADLWFVVACGQYWRVTGDEAFLDHIHEPLGKVQFLLGAWEYNNRGLLYVPLTGDWSDEYIHSGYVLYDQLLYLQAQRELCNIHRHCHDSDDHVLRDKCDHLMHMIRSNYWVVSSEELPADVYHPVLYEKSSLVPNHCRGKYWMSFFAPTGYGYRFDAMANILASLTDAADDIQRERVDRYINRWAVADEVMLIPAFHPVITPMDKDWEELQMSFQYKFRNEPYEYHNGGLWPLVTGFYAADLAQRGQKELARKYLEGIHRANATEMEGHRWGFPEFLNGETYEPGGPMNQGWSAGAAVMAHHALEGKPVFEK